MLRSNTFILHKGYVLLKINIEGVALSPLIVIMLMTLPPLNEWKFLALYIFSHMRKGI